MSGSCTPGSKETYAPAREKFLRQAPEFLLFHESFAEPHVHAALHLPARERRIECAANVMRDPDLGNSNPAGNWIHLDLDHCGRVGVSGRWSHATTLIERWRLRWSVGTDCANRPEASLRQANCFLKGDPFPATVASNIRLSAKRSRSLGTSRRRATASASIAFARSAACIAAFPAIKVTRLEYDPRSTGPRSVSPVYTRISNVVMPRTSATMAASTSSEPCRFPLPRKKR